jgi:hypothetical protein
MKILLLTIFFSVSVSSNVLDDLIIKKKPLINQIIIELLETGMTDEWENLDSSASSKLGTDICKAGGGSSCSYVTNIGYGICKAGGGSSCSYVTNIGYGICKAGGGSSCSYVSSIQAGIKKIPYKDRTYWWDKFRDQYGNYQWRCRGGQTKQFAENSKCSGVSKDDERWPG